MNSMPAACRKVEYERSASLSPAGVHLVMEDAVLQSMCVRVPRVHEVFDSCPPPQAPTTTTTTSSSSQVRNTRGSFKGTTGSNVPRQQREAHPASSSQYSTDASPMPSSRPLDSDMSDDGMFSPGDHMGHPQQPIITIPSSPTRVRHAPIVPARSGHASKELIVPGLHRNSVDRNIKYRTDVRLAREGTDPISRCDESVGFQFCRNSTRACIA